MDLEKLEQLLDKGERFTVTYRYPVAQWYGDEEQRYRTRSDRLLAVEPKNSRLFVSFRDERPAWIELDEVVRIEAAGA